MLLTWVLQGIYIENICEFEVSNSKEANELLRIGQKRRHIGSTHVNELSSRSHSVFTVTLTCEDVGGAVKSKKVSRFNLIDLAGSERQKNTHTSGESLKEANTINKSLSLLGQVVMALAKGHAHIPYRDSKLTFMLKDSLGGNSLTAFIAAVSPGDRSIDETLSTLKFVRFAAMVKNVATVHEEMEADPRALQEEIVRLRATVLELSKRPDMPAPPSPKLSETLNANIRTEYIIDPNTQHALKMSSLREAQLLHDLSCLQQQHAMAQEVFEQVKKELDKKAQSMQMMVKLKDTAIAKLTAANAATVPVAVDEQVQLLRTENDALRAIHSSNPEVVKLSLDRDLMLKQISDLKSKLESRGLPESTAAGMDSPQINQLLLLHRNLHDEKTELQSTLNDAVETCETYSVSIRALQDALSMLKAEVEQLQTAVAQRDKQLEQEEISKNELVNALEEAKETSRSMMNDLSTTHQSLVMTTAAHNSVAQQLECVKGEYAAKVQEYDSTIKTANEEFASKEKQLTTELASTKKAADKVSAELESTKGKLDKATAKGKELGDEVKELKGQLSQSQKEHDAAVKAGSALSQQLECVKGEYAAKVQEYDSTIKTANEEFASKEKQLTTELASTKKAADKVSAELESTKGKLDKATAKGKELGDEVKAYVSSLEQLQVQCQSFQSSSQKFSAEVESLKSQLIVKQRDHDSALQAVHDDVAVHIESGIRAAQKLFSSDLASSKKTIDKLSSDLKIAVARAEGAEQTLSVLRSDLQSTSRVVPAPSDASQKVEVKAALESAAGKATDATKPAEAAPPVMPDSRRRVLECAPAHIVDGPAERPKRRPLSSVDTNAAACSQQSKVHTHASNSTVALSE